MELITVIVPVYKVEKYLRRCIDSIIAQSYKNLEIILVDDGSPDNCGRICDEYAKKDDRIRVIHQKNGGLSAARNTGLDIATGDYIGFVDSDDYIAPDMYEKLLSLIISENADIAICNYQMVDENGQIIKTDQGIQNGVLTNYQALKELQGNNDGVFIIACNKLFSAKTIKTDRFPVGRLCEDNYIIHKLFFFSKKVAVTDSRFYYYTQRAGSIMRNKDLRFLTDEMEGFLARLQFYEEEGLTELIDGCKKCILGLYRRRISYLLNNLDLKAFKEKYDSILQKMYQDICFQCSFKDRIFFKHRSCYILFYKHFRSKK